MWAQRKVRAAETAAMTRIGRATGALNGPSTDSSGASAGEPADRASAALGSMATGAGLLCGDGGPDRPARQSGVGSGHTPDAHVFFADIRRWQGEHPFMYVDT